MIGEPGQDKTEAKARDKIGKNKENGACKMLDKHMDNPSYGDAEKNSVGTELRVVTSSKISSYGPSVPSESVVITCTPEVCRAARQRHPPPDLAGNPWHKKKTILLLSIIGLFVAWIVIFTILSQLKLL